MSRKTVIIAGNGAQAYLACQELNISSKSINTIIVYERFGLERFRGMQYQEGDRIHFEGTWYERSDLKELREELRIIGFPQEMLW